MEQIVSHLVEQLSCNPVVRGYFLRTRLGALKVLDMTASELFAEAEKEGWAAWVSELTLAELAELLASAGAPAPEEWRQLIGAAAGTQSTSSSPPKPRPARSKPPAAEVPVEVPALSLEEQRKQSILEFLRANPWSTRAQIEQALCAFSLEDIFRQLDEMVELGCLKSVESETETRFALS